jgi:hypothetical protein
MMNESRVIGLIKALGENGTGGGGGSLIIHATFNDDLQIDNDAGTRQGTLTTDVSFSEALAACNNGIIPVFRVRQDEDVYEYVNLVMSSPDTILFSSYINGMTTAVIFMPEMCMYQSVE